MNDVTTVDFILGVVLALLAVAAYAFGAVSQLKLATSSRRSTFGYVSALGFNLAGGVLHVIALRFGSLSVVQPVGALTLVVALPTAAVMLHQRINPLKWWGAGITIAGVAGMVSLIRPADGGQL